MIIRLPNVIILVDNEDVSVIAGPSNFVPGEKTSQHAVGDQAVSAHHCQQLVVQGFHHIAQLFVGLSKRLTESFFSNKRRRG